MALRTYNVYVDEVFEHFMNLPQMDGYFAYTGLILPEDKEHQLSAFWAALDLRLKNAYERATNFRIQGEFKSTYLKKLPFEDRMDASKRIAYFLNKNSGYIATFYTTVHALMCWELRTWAGYEDREELVEYSEERLEAKAAQLRGEKKKQAGESRILEGLFQTISSIPLSWIRVLGGQFRIQYDSRDPKEDRVLFKLLNELFPRLKEVDPQRGAPYLGGQGLDSSTSPGLMLTDLICKEFRDFVHACPEILTDRSEFRLITPTSREGILIPITIGGHTMKWGSAKEMSVPTIEKLVRIAKTSPFVELAPNLADNKLSCYAHFGEGRI